MQFPFITHGMVLYKRQYIIYRQNTNIEKMYVHADRASLEIFGIFTFLNWYFFQ